MFSQRSAAAAVGVVAVRAAAVGVVAVRAADYFAGRDPLLEAVLAGEAG